MIILFFHFVCNIAVNEIEYISSVGVFVSGCGVDIWRYIDGNGDGSACRSLYLSFGATQYISFLIESQ